MAVTRILTDGVANTAITSLGTLSTLTVDNVNINGNSIVATSGALNITPAAGSALVLDGTVNIDAGVITGATSVTSTAFVGALDGVLGGSTPAAAAITTLTLTNDLTVANGGTGASTFTANGLLVGNGTGAVTATAVGTDNHVLTSNGSGNAPTFQAIGNAASVGGYSVVVASSLPGSPDSSTIYFLT